MENMMLVAAVEERLCHTCEKPIAVGEEMILEFGLEKVKDHPTFYHHLKCVVDLCEECIKELRKEEAEFLADDAAETAKLVEQMGENER